MSDGHFADVRQHINAGLAGFRGQQPDTLKGFNALHAAAFEPGALDKATKELIALEISVATRCEPCVVFHTPGALKAGASPEQITEMLSVAVLMGGGPSLMYAAKVVQALEEEDAS
jgi:AhpD family alkylhydroperoxidase